MKRTIIAVLIFVYHSFRKALIDGCDVFPEMPACVRCETAIDMEESPSPSLTD